MEFHVSRAVRTKFDIYDLLFGYAGNAIFANLAATREFARKFNEARAASGETGPILHAGALFAMGLIDELSHALVASYRKNTDPALLADGLRFLGSREPDPSVVEHLLYTFADQFPNTAIFNGQLNPAEWLAGTTPANEANSLQPMPNREAALEELLLLWLANLNPAFVPFKELFDDRPLAAQTVYKHVTGEFDDYFATRPPISPTIGSLLNALRAPMLASPDSLSGQLAYMRDHWADLLSPEFRDLLERTLFAIDTLQEEEIAIWRLFHPGGQRHHNRPTGFGAEGFEGDEFVGFGGRRAQPLHEYEAFSPDQAWMPTVVLIAKSTYVWLEQLSRKFQRHIHRLDQIPNEELALLAGRGINGLWLIGLWERSTASQTIKRLRGQYDAVASAYSLKDYRIADDLGGTYAYERLRDQAAAHGIRLASDMVPNHMGIDSTWVMEHPEWFLSRQDSPFPSYTFHGPDLSTEARFEIKIEDHYYEETDAAVVFQLRERASGHTRFVYHGNDGTTFAWNDTAQLDYSKGFVREQVIQTILSVARLFPIIRFDAAMTLAKKHVQRLWFPLPGHGGGIPSRAEFAMSQEEFDALMPNEFWREVVDRVAAEVPGTLLLAEAFWLLEGYFVRTLGMHRVYNSAFMNMLRDEENAKYRSYLKKTIEFDPDILKRYVNFMSNPDERTAIDQFGTGDKYFGICTMLATLPGLPMFGHGQIEAFTEKYGMEYKRARYEEWPNEDLVARHMREIAPLLKNRHVFAESNNFVLYDFWNDHGKVDENVFAYSNRVDNGHGAPNQLPDRALILYNNAYQSTRGTIHLSAASMDKGSGQLHSRTLKEALALPWQGDVFLAWRDTACNLEYLRRASDLDHSGFTIDLRGYQYAVLLHWRELRPSADQPWDQLCDHLQGTGVPNLDEALVKLRLRPLHDALRSALAPDIIATFIELSTEPATEPVGVGPESGGGKESGGAGKESGGAGKESGAPGLASETWVPTHQPAASTPPTDLSREASSHSPLPVAVSAALASRETIPGKNHVEAALPPAPAAEWQLPTAFEPASTSSKSGAAGPPSTPAKPGDPDPRLTPFLNRAQAFFEQLRLAAPAAALALLPNLAQSSSALLYLPALERHLTHPWPATARLVLPTAHRTPQPNVAPWAAALAWLLLARLAPEAPSSEATTTDAPTSHVRTSDAAMSEAAARFDQLHLRSALAEAFTTLGMAGEDAWRLAARVRILLAHRTHATASAIDVLATDGFWNDPDVRWLAGLNQSQGITYLNKEAFEELLWWLALPPLLAAAQADPATQPTLVRKIESDIATYTTAAAQAGYDLAKLLHPPQPSTKSETSSETTSKSSDRTSSKPIDANN
jgi:Alpha amylase, catalytic domain